MNLTLDQLTTLLALMKDKKWFKKNSGWNSYDEDLYKILGDEWLERVKKEDPKSQRLYFEKVRGEK